MFKPIVVDATGGQLATYRQKAGTVFEISSEITMNGTLEVVGLQYNPYSKEVLLSGSLQGAGGLTVTNGGTYGAPIVYLTSNNNIYAGTTTITNGTLSIGHNGTTGRSVERATWL